MSRANIQIRRLKYTPGNRNKNWYSDGNGFVFSC